MIHVAAYGRLGGDPRSVTTKTGKQMVVASLAVNLDEAGEAEWFGLVAFGRQAELLLKHEKGQCLSVSGRLQRRTWEKDGQQRTQLQIVLDGLVSARTARPGNARKREPKSEDQTPALPMPGKAPDESPEAKPAAAATSTAAAESDGFDDDIPF